MGVGVVVGSTAGIFVLGSLLGITVARHGTSARIMTARVVGTRGQTTVTGAQLQGLFGLDSTLAAFTTITTQDPPGGLAGTIFPAPRGTVAVQSYAGGRWRTISRSRTNVTKLLLRCNGSNVRISTQKSPRPMACMRCVIFG